MASNNQAPADVSDWPDWPPDVLEHLRKQRQAEMERQEAARQKRLAFSQTLISRLRWEWEHRDAEGRSVCRVSHNLLKQLEWEGGGERRFRESLAGFGRDYVDEMRDEYPLAAVIRALNAVEAVSR